LAEDDVAGADADTGDTQTKQPSSSQDAASAAADVYVKDQEKLPSGERTSFLFMLKSTFSYTCNTSYHQQNFSLHKLSVLRLLRRRFQFSILRDDTFSP